ncbi:hypothetical protein HKD37_20G056048 [Glycine soja]
MASRNENAPAIVYYNAYVADCDEGVEFKGINNTTPQLNEPSQLNVDPTIYIHVAQSESNKMSHDYMLKMGCRMNDDEDEILADNNNNDDNDDNDIQFIFQQTSTENVYRPYPNSADVGDNQVPDNPDYRHFFGPTLNMSIVHTKLRCLWHIHGIFLSNVLESHL